MPILLPILIVVAAVAAYAMGNAADESDMSPKTLAKLNECTPRFRPMALAILTALDAAGIPYFVGDVFRESTKSDSLYAAFLAGGPRAAPGGDSAHNYREGMDVNLLDGNGKVIDAVTHPSYVTFGKIVRRVGAVWGGDYHGDKDGPHFEHPKWRELKSTAGV